MYLYKNNEKLKAAVYRLSINLSRQCLNNKIIESVRS